MVDVERFFQRIKNRHRGPTSGEARADFEGMFNRALEEINGTYMPGTIRFTRENHPVLWEKITRTENQIASSWLSGEAEKFNEALDDWKATNFQSIELFRKNGMKINDGKESAGLESVYHRGRETQRKRKATVPGG